MPMKRTHFLRPVSSRRRPWKKINIINTSSLCIAYHFLLATPLASRIQILSELSVLRTCSWQGWIVFFKLWKKLRDFYLISIRHFDVKIYIYTNCAIDHALQRWNRQCRRCRTAWWFAGSVLRRGRTGGAAWRRYHPIRTMTDPPSGRRSGATVTILRVRRGAIRASATSSISTGPVCSNVSASSNKTSDLKTWNTSASSSSLVSITSASITHQPNRCAPINWRA